MLHTVYWSLEKDYHKAATSIIELSEHSVLVSVLLFWHICRYFKYTIKICLVSHTKNNESFRDTEKTCKAYHTL